MERGDLPLLALPVVPGLQSGEGSIKWAEGPHSLSTVPRRPAPLHSAWRPKLFPFPSSSKPPEGKGRHPRPDLGTAGHRSPRPSTALGHRHTHTQAREARLYSTPTLTFLTCTSRNTSAPGALVLCPGPATPATSFVRTAAALPEAHAHTLHPGSRGRPDTAPRNLDHLGTQDQPRDPRPPASPSPARRAVGLGVPALRSPPSPTVPRSGLRAEGREREREMGQH